MLSQDYLTYLKNNGRSKNTIRQYEFHFKNLNEIKPLDDWTKDDVNNYISQMRLDGYSASTMETRKTILKALFKWAKKPAIAEDLHIRAINTPLNRKDILSIDEINKLIGSTESHMYKALIAFLFESGGRINEVLPIIVDEIEETDKGMIIPVHQTKTGIADRRILCIFSTQYIRNQIAYSGLSKGDRLFPVVDISVWEMLKKIGKKAGIEKPISAHMFRHAQAVDMLKRGYQDQITKKKLGWTGDSKMLARYSHVVDDDVINATLDKSGMDIPKQPIQNINQAEPLKITDASMIINKLASDNEEMQEKLKQYELDRDKTNKEMDAKLEKMRKIFSHAYVATEDGYVHPKED